MIIKKIVSGAQTGTDQGALKAAERYGIPTGGFVPKNCRTLDGNRPDLLIKYNLTETKSTGYRERTYFNVLESDGTIRFAHTFESPGERCTLNAIKQYKKPHFDIDIHNPPKYVEVIKWIVDNNIKILNVAGNSEKTSKGIEKFVQKFLEKIFERLLLLDEKKYNIN